MTATFRFHQLDVFTATPLKGNPLAVVHGADALDAAQMQAFANWTNLSETTFLLAPTTAGADYRVRIFTPARELPFAGHPTLGSCHAWLAAGGQPHSDEIVQQCGEFGPKPRGVQLERRRQFDFNQLRQFRGDSQSRTIDVVSFHRSPG